MHFIFEGCFFLFNFFFYYLSCTVVQTFHLKVDGLHHSNVEFLAGKKYRIKLNVSIAPNCYAAHDDSRNYYISSTIQYVNLMDERVIDFSKLFDPENAKSISGCIYHTDPNKQ